MHIINIVKVSKKLIAIEKQWHTMRLSIYIMYQEDLSQPRQFQGTKAFRVTA